MSYFYEELLPRERQFVEMMCNGEFLQKDPDEAIDYLDDLAEKAHTWTRPSATESTNRSRPIGNLNSTGIYHLRKEDNLRAKRKHYVKKTTFLTKQVSGVIEQKILPKYKDTGCPTMSCTIGNHEFVQALLDLGVIVNFMPYAIYSVLGLCEIKPTSVVLILIILGRPFLVTTNALVNYRNDLTKLSFGNMTLEVNIFHIMKQPEEDDEYHQTFMNDDYGISLVFISNEFGGMQRILQMPWLDAD
ncbi:uncharacterized protein LOC111372976 [Olea europaea var. sylvestris]|uniref:uncharacterized protein LOC111372976 n=1 Tax=Olea europaea var. sylvestris TaxID=158386 RepID=UPI000C1D724C|nr:uncharacterized protein LOC111372976 [Olea europaea var. sylvestris]